MVKNEVKPEREFKRPQYSAQHLSVFNNVLVILVMVVSFLKVDITTTKEESLPLTILQPQVTISFFVENNLFRLDSLW